VETLNLPPVQTYAAAMGLGWRLARQRFWSFLWLFFLAALLALLPLVAVAILQRFVPHLDLLWQLALFLLVNAWIVASFRAIHIALAGERPRFAAFTGWLRRSATWLTALPPALYAFIINYLHPAPPPGVPTAALMHFFLSPGYLLTVLLGILVTPWYQYAYALYGSGGHSPAEAYRLALRIYGDRLRWLFLPLVLGLILLLAAVVSGLALALLAALLAAALKLLGLVALGKALTAGILLLYLLAFLCAAAVFVFASLSAAATTLEPADPLQSFRP